MTEDASTQNQALAGHLLDHYAGRIARTHRPYVLGLSGLQGSGKSTLARVIKTQAEQRGWPTEVLALDDFYYSRSERETLSHQIHPLLRTRGVPLEKRRGDAHRNFHSAIRPTRLSKTVSSPANFDRANA